MSLLFEPGHIGNMTLKNHFVGTATGGDLCTPDGECTNHLINFYRQLADGGTGLIITGAAYVHPMGQIGRFIGLYDDRLIEGYRKLTRAVHAYSAKIIARIFLPCHTGFNLPETPSAVKVALTGLSPMELTEAEIQEFISAFGLAARRARDAGFDGVQLHAAHGYLIHSFLSPFTNRRTDQWGGSFENNMRFPLACYQTCRDSVGSDFPILIKVSIHDHKEGGITLDLGKHYAEKLNEMGFDAIETSVGMGFDQPAFSMNKDYLPAEDIPGNSLEQASRLIKHTPNFQANNQFQGAFFRSLTREIKKVVDIPVILPGDHETVANMDETLQSGDADFIGLCFPLVREPDFPNKIMKWIFLNKSW